MRPVRDRSDSLEARQRTRRDAVQVTVMLLVGEVGGATLDLQQVLEESANGGSEAIRRLAAGEPDECDRLGVLVVRSRVHVVSEVAHSMRPGSIIYTLSGGKSLTPSRRAHQRSGASLRQCRRD